ncbi:MAG: hypothetical protein JJU05_02465 [Verrucomicrobia bacterium]|nr:hypothetical protein [Verrucomicrobiota bacterium]MCH8526906.1 hypothetical protein [Kiritimatiellia bacterium]
MKESDFNSREEYVKARIAYLRNKMKDLEDILDYCADEDDPEEELAFLEHIYVMESQPSVTHAHQLIAAGVSLPPPDDLSDSELHDKLWEIIHKLAELRVFFDNTNHLTDRTLYERLWTETLNEFTWDMSNALNGAMHIDMCGSGSEADTADWLSFFASEEDRQDWMETYPDDPLPPRRTPPMDRDAALPQPDIDFGDDWDEDIDGEYPF